jgi:hypothetical protein
MEQFVNASSVRPGNSTAEISATMSGLDVLRIWKLLVVTGRRPRSVHETAVVPTHAHFMELELGSDPPSACTTTNMRTAANSVGAILS